MTTSTQICSTCGRACIPIVYGLPGEELIAEARAGKIRLGGCEIYDGQPQWTCPEGHELSRTS